MRWVGNIEWWDVATHAVIAAILTIIFSHFVGPWYAALVVSVFFWLREAWQHRNRPSTGSFWRALLPLRWGRGAQLELYAPMISAIVFAAFITVI